MGLFSRLFNRTVAPPMVRRFDGAAGGRRGFGMGGFGGINSEVAAAGASLRSRAAYLAINNPWLSQACANWTGALVGPGIQPTAKHPAAETRCVLNLYFQTWAERADAESRTDFWGLQAIAVDSMVKVGEAVAILSDTPEGPRLRLLPPDLLDEAKTENRSIYSGVELDSDGRRVAYWILPDRPGNAFSTYAPSIRVSAETVLHVFKPQAPGQLRGVSWLAPVILPASEFDQLCDALLMGAKVAAMHAAFLIDMNGTGEPYSGFEAGGIMETGLQPGTMKRLPSGLDVKFNTPGQIAQIDAFLKLNLRQLAAGLHIPDHLLSGDLSCANYSSLRAGLLPFRQRVEQIQYAVLVPQFLAPV